MRLPREWRRTSVESFSDDGRYVEYRFAAPLMINFHILCLYRLGDPDLDPVQSSTLKSLGAVPRVQEAAQEVYLGDA
jgi:hypothetical protein